ncbi:VOC family protein [Streptomyces sp. TLI_171]|uniref:VOC family protein n=1 Tax=Streptomyces sp. TLI_171 TaxID=1938859 RepID=UPI00217E0423|nr:VOC family protein [Streptomyces sp. TLI_171]
MHVLEIGGVEGGYHPVDDERDPPGRKPVVYRGVDDLDAVRERLLAAGCEHHRGPPTTEPSRRIAQLRAPFGTTVGIEGP